MEEDVTTRSDELGSDLNNSRLTLPAVSTLTAEAELTSRQRRLAHLARQMAEEMSSGMSVGEVMAVVKAEVDQSRLRSSLGKELGRLREVDLAFLVDCTDSMDPYLDQVKKYIRHIVDTIKERSVLIIRVKAGLEISQKSSDSDKCT